MDTYSLQGNFALRHSLDSLAVTHFVKVDPSTTLIAKEIRYCVIAIATAFTIVGVTRALVPLLRPSPDTT